MIFDVDGVLTDGRLWYGPEGESLKVFHVVDGHGIVITSYSIHYTKLYDYTTRHCCFANRLQD